MIDECSFKPYACPGSSVCCDFQHEINELPNDNVNPYVSPWTDSSNIEMKPRQLKTSHVAEEELDEWTSATNVGYTIKSY